MDKFRKHHNADAPPPDGETSGKEAKSAEERVESVIADPANTDSGDELKECQAEGQAADDVMKKLTEELESLKDLMQRRQADFENYKKRQMKMQQDQKRLAIKDLALDILQINDDLLRAIELGMQGPSEDAHNSFVEGVSMISRRIEETMTKYGITEIDALNCPFDPNIHEAVEIEMSPDVDTDTVTKVYQKGFKIEDFVLRNARVRVAKAVKAAAGETGMESGISGGPGEGEPGDADNDNRM